jgi:hypothetical protein
MKEHPDTAMHRDRGYEWHLADWLEQPRRISDGGHIREAGRILREAMHDRDRFQRERDYAREVIDGSI